MERVSLPPTMAGIVGQQMLWEDSTHQEQRIQNYTFFLFSFPVEIPCPLQPPSRPLWCCWDCSRRQRKKITCGNQHLLLRRREKLKGNARTLHGPARGFHCNQSMSQSHLPAGDGGNAVAASLFALCLFPKIQTPRCPGNLQPPFLEVAPLQYHVWWPCLYSCK